MTTTRKLAATILALLALFAAPRGMLTQTATAEDGFTVDDFLDDALASPVQTSPAASALPWDQPSQPFVPAPGFGSLPATNLGATPLPAPANDWTQWVPVERTPLKLGIWGCGTRDGVVLEDVAAGSLAQRRGYEPGDTIVSVNGRRTQRIDDLQAALREPVDTFVIVVRDVRTGNYVTDTIRR